MSETLDSHYRGIPIPNWSDYVTLTKIKPDVHEASPVSDSELSRYVEEFHPKIIEIIEHDIECWLLDEGLKQFGDNYKFHNRDKSKDLLEKEFTLGIINGYDFFMALTVNLKFIRSDYSSIWHFIFDSQKTGALPIIGELELERIKQVREGRALVELAPENNYIQSSEEYSYFDAMTYSTTSSRFDLLVNDAIERDEINRSVSSKIRRTPRKAKSYRKGFEHGTHNALEMYLQVDETGALSNMMNDLNTLYDHFEDTPPFRL
jgi:hypothetical protein